MVMKMERVTLASRANMTLLQHLFSPGDLKAHSALVLTHWPGEIGEEKRDLEAWIGGDSDIQQLVSSFGKVVLTNNQLARRGAYPESRKKCLDELTGFIELQETRMLTVPVNIMEVIDANLVARFRRALWGSIVHVRDLLPSSPSSGEVFPTFCGECSVCLEQIDIAQVCKLHCDQASTEAASQPHPLVRVSSAHFAARLVSGDRGGPCGRV
eukprot:CAMPEP_0175396398 /NCGR_PEP_ID=MMETSP0095-20121207/34434_1 /TAXON_ID=311494 /ORGANISM="Alexandrium monilatum, Strain CCMP3105" /LENGTH=211 /DNA_ID=CAMNT_0016695039 /DNA_START=258 /DNA_END=890 /DNA_ORIENTATION=-